MADEQPKPLFMIDPNGETVPIDPAQARAAIQQGYALASPEQMRDYNLQQKYGEGVGNQVKAFGAGVARGATLGLSDLALTKTGLSTPEALKSREEYNPGSSMLGEAAGVLAPAVLTGGASAAAEGAGEAGVSGAARLIPSNVVSSAGHAVEGAVSRLMPAAGDSLASRIVAKAVPKAAGSAIEGMAYAGGHEVSEAALGDPDQTAESVMAHVALGGLFGVGLGGLIGVGEEAIPAFVTKAKDVLGNVYKSGEGLLEKAYGGAEGVTGQGADSVSMLFENKQAVADLKSLVPGATEALDNATPEMKAWMLKNGDKLGEMETAFPGSAKQLARVDPATADFLTDNWSKVTTDPQARIAVANKMRSGMQDVFNSVESVLKRSNREFAPAEEEAFLNASGMNVSAKQSYGKLLDKVDEAVKKMRSEPELYNQSFARKLETVQAGLVRDLQNVSDEVAATGKTLADDPLHVFRRLKTLRQQLDEDIKFGADARALGISDRNANNLFKELRGTIKETLTDSQTFGPIAARKAALDDAQSEWLKLTGRGGAFRKLFLDREGNIPAAKVERWLNAMSRSKGDEAAEAWGNLMGSARKVVKEAEESYKAAPTGEFSREGMDSLINNTGDMIAEARQGGKATSMMKDLSNGGTGIANGGPFNSMVEKAAGFIPGGRTVLGVAATLKSTSKTVAALAWLERAGAKVSAAIDTGTQALVKGGARAAGVGRGEVAAGMSSHASKPYAEQEKDFERQTQRLTQLAGDPQQMLEELNRAGAGLYAHAPKASQSLSIKQSAAVSFLASKVPQHPKGGPMSANWKPTPSEMGKFHRYVEATQKPLSLLRKARAGNLMPEHVEVLQTIYPGIHSKIRQGIMSSMPKDPTKVPYRSRAGISMLLGAPADGSFTPEAIRANQAIMVFQQKQPGATGGQGPTAGGLAKLTLSSRLLTPQQTSAQRKP